MKALKIDALVKEYNGVNAVKGISFQIEPGEVFGLIGPNGAGKTTTLRCISTLIQVNSGSIEVFGISLKDEPGKIRNMISYLPEEAGAYKNLTGRQYLEFIASFFTDKNTDELVARGIDIASLGKRINDKVDKYSKGMTRRLLIARALMIKPRLAILDEPTSGLDVVNAKEVRDTILNAVSDDNAVLLFSCCEHKYSFSESGGYRVSNL
ncbi:MAG: ABC transporter ATP-binding protein [bacterium]